MISKLQQSYKERLIAVTNLSEIPINTYMVYILYYNGKPIVLGHGKKNRSKVILDNLDTITSGHIKALFVRLYALYGKGDFQRFIILSDNKVDSQKIERDLHEEIGGNNRVIPAEIRSKLFEGLETNSVASLILEIAIRSSFDGISDIRKWRKDGLLNDETWAIISSRLHL